MTSRAAARRFARALFDVVRAERADLDRAGRELAEFAGLVSANDRLMRALTHPAVPSPKKRAVVEQLIARAGGLLPQVSKLLLLLAERDRLVLLPDVAEQYRDRLMDHRRVVRAEVVTAAAVPSERIAALRDGLARAMGRDVELEARVDESIVGGAIARVGSTVFDGSLTRQLQKMRDALVREGAHRG
ncbi:MAG TPA: ATP synthase F1 subunit delta [Vicinamibacterales bacterium]|nr:ATP synthase F1 subunit delta [Vicinamibacterales bacterium]